MKIFIDTAIIKEIEWSIERGLIDGVTTNPTLLNKADHKLGDVVNDILEVVPDQPVHITVVSQTADQIIDEAKTVAKLAKNVVVKIPMTDEGMMAIQELSAKGIKTNVTLVFNMAQAMLAARSGAHQITFFDGKADAPTESEMAVVAETVKIFRAYDIKTEILLGAVRDVSHVEHAARIGVSGAAIPFKVLVQMYRHDLTDKGLKQFLADWENIPK